MATLDDYMKRITGKDNKKKEEEQKLRFNKTSDTSIQKRLKDYASVVGKAYDDEQKYISSLSPVDQSAYKRVKASNYVYSSPYLKKGREGKSDLEYGDTSWNQLSKEEKERWFDTVEKNPNANYNDKDIPWQARYAYDIMNASQTTNVGAFGANKKKMFDLQTEQKWMWNSLPAKVRNGIRTGDKEAMDYLKKNYSSDEISMFQKYAELMSDVEDVESIKEMQSDLMESNPVYAVGIAPIQQIGADIGAAMVSAPRTLWNLASERGNYDVVNPYDSFLQKAAEAGRGVQQEILEGLDDRKLMQAYYGASVSTAESALRLGLAHGAATVLTKIPALSSLPYDKVAGIAMNGLMFPSVVQQSAVEMQQKGVPASQALAKAISAGIFECLFETISFDKLGFFNETPVVGSVKTFAKNLLKSGFVEGSEEVATDIANEIYDYFAMYDYSDFKAFKDKLEADSGEPISDKEAWKLYGSEFADKLTESFLGGAFSGMTMGGTTNARGIANYRAYESMGANVNDATAARMTPVINDLMSNPNIAARMELVSDSETARRGMMQEIFNNMERMYGSRIEKATEKSLPVIMQNINTSLNGVISEDLINKYNAKMIEFGKGDEQVDYAKYRQNMEKGNQTTFDDMAYGEGDASVLQEYEKANKEYRDAMFDGSLDAQYRVEAMNKAEEQMEQSRQAAIEIVENAAARGESLDSPALRKYVSVLGIEDSARAYSAAKVAGENASVKVKKGSVSSISREEASAVFGDNAGDIEEVTYQNIEHNPDFKEGLYFGQIVAKMTGADVKLYKSTRQNIQNGAYHNGTIYIDVNAGHSGEAAALGEVFSHELTHWMRDNNEAGYQNLLDFVRSNAGESFDNLVNAKLNQMKKIAEKTGHPEMELDENGAQEEIIAEACQKMLYSSETFMEYAKADLQGAKNFVERFKDFLKRVRNAFRGSLHSDPTDVIGKLEGLAAEWEKALNEAIANVSQTAAEGIIENKPSVAENIVGTELVTKDSVKSSQRLNNELMERAKKEFAKVGKQLGISYQDFYRAIALCNTIANRMLDPNDLAYYLPEDNPGKVEVGNASYGRSMENAMECIRSIVNNDFTDMVSEAVGRPLTVEEQLVASQILQIVNSRPECNYCYVATDRRAYRASFGTYFKQYEDVYNKVAKNREAFSKDLNGAEKRMEAVKVDGGEKNLGKGVVAKAYAEFLNGRKNTPDMRKRFLGWVNSAVKGEMPISRRDLTSARVRDKAREDAAKKWFINDAEKYAQSATWAKKVSRVIKVGGKDYVAKYVSYNGSILKWNQTLIDKLNEEFGLRMYSFSDYVPAFILENMQMIIDASLRGLKVLAYTKDCGFAEAFAETGAGINISLFGTLDKKAYKDENLNALREAYKANKNDATRKAYLDALNQYVVRDGIGGKDGMMGANWDRASALRKTYKNVGTVFVATNDDLVEWALANPEIDVVIPYHLVRTGEEVAAFFDYKNFKAQQEDKKTKAWTSANLKSIPPTVHGNDLATYKQALKDNNLEPRFADFIDNPNYMKLVNETRLSYKEMSPVQPIFDQSIIEREVGRIKDEGQYGLMPGFKTKAEQDAFIENQNLVGQAVDAIGEWNESGKKPIDDTKYSSRITMGMSDEEREKILRNATFEAEEYLGNAEDGIALVNDDLEKKGKQFIKSALKSAWKFFEMPKYYKNAEYDLEVYISNGRRGTFVESSTKGIHDPKALIKLMPNIEYAVKNAIGLEAHENRYYADQQTTQFLSLLGGYVDGDYFIPIRFGIKMSESNGNKLYVVIDSEGIKKDKVLKQRKDVNPLNRSRLSYDVIVANVLENVNNPEILRYIPDGFLDEDRVGIKYSAIAETLKDTNDKNDKAYREYSRKNDHDSMRIMLEKAAKAHGFEYNDDIAWLKTNPNIIKSMADRTFDDNDDLIPISKRFDATTTDTRYATRDSRSIEEINADYMKAYESGDERLMSRYVEEAARRAGYNSPKVFHGTRFFGWTRYKDDSHDTPFIYTSTDSSVSANYAGDNHYAGIRKIGKAFKHSNDINDIIQNAESVYDTKYHIATNKERQTVYDEVVKEASEIADKLNTFDATFDFDDELANAMARIESAFWTVQSFNDEWGDKWNDNRQTKLDLLKSDLRSHEEDREKLRNWYGEHRNELSSEQKKFMSYLLSYEVGDTLIDMEYSLEKALYDGQIIASDVRGMYSAVSVNFAIPSEIQDAMEQIHNIGSYQLYGDIGDNPLEFDANGSQFWALKVPQMGDDEYHGTDAVSKWAAENGYTSVIMHNIYDYGNKADNYVFFSSNQLKSADPVTYDDNGNVIPLTERFNKENEDIRYSTRMSMAELDEAYENAYNEYDDDRMQELVDIAAEKAGYKYKAFHHTESDFTVFDIAKARKSMDIQAFFFSADPNAESEYGSKRYDVFLKMENPYIVDSKESAERIPFDLSKENAGVTAREWLLENGYDSVIRKADYYGAEADEYVVLNANQIKSADAMTFDENDELIPLSERFNSYNDDIRYSYRDLANSESEILVNALKNDAALVDELGAKQSIEAYAREYNRLKEMEQQQIDITKQLNKNGTSPSEREVLLKKMVRLDRAILNKTTELTEMRNQRVIRDLLISEWDKRDTLVAAGRAEERYLTRKALEEKYGKELSALKEKTRQQKQEIRDRHTINERKARIIKKTKQLMDMCLHPTEKKKVPTVLINPVVELLDAIDYWTPAEGRRVTKKSESLRERFVNFREAINEYQEQINEGTEQIEYMFDPEFLETVDELAKSVKGINNVNDMNAEEITALDQTLTQLHHLISRGNKMITASHYQTVNEYTDKTRQAMEKKKTLSEKTSAKGSWLSRLNAGMADTYAFGEYAGEGTREIVDMLSKAFEDKEFHVKEAIDFTQEVLKPYKKELKKWSQDEHEFTLSTTDKDGNPNKVKLTVGQMMELYLLNKREQARGHIYGGGIRVENRKGKFTESVKITESDVAEIMEYLKSVPGAMEVADKLQQYGATTITGWGNQASNLMYGISKFTDENYWQIRSDSSALKDNENTEKALNASMYRLQNMGRTKAVKKGANNAIYIGDVFDTWSKTIDEMTSYASILPATTDAMRWWNSRVDLDGENTVRVKKLLESKLGTDMTRVFTDTIKALNGGIMGTDSLESLVKKLTGKAKAAAVAGNLRVVLQQPTAYTRAAAVIDKKYLLKALTMKPNAKEAQEHSAIAWHKAQGFYSNGLAPSLRKMVIGDASIGESLTEKSLWLAGKADDITWGALWNASKLKVEAENKALKVGSDAYWNEVNKVFSNIINQTQVVDTPLTKSTWMRGNGLGVYFTAFMAEPTKTYSMVMERLDRVLQNPTSKDAWKAFAGVGAVFAVNAMVNAMAQALADAARDDDKEKDYWEKYIEQYQEDVKDNINPLTYIPVVKDIWSLSQGYSNSNLSMQAAQNTVYAVNELKKIANGTSKKTLFGQAETVAKAISGWTGIPVGNVMRTLNSIGNVAGLDIFRRKKYTNTELGRNIVLSMNEGDEAAADKYMAELLENVKGDKNKAEGYVIDYLADHDDEINEWAERYMDDATVLVDAIDELSNKYSSDIVTKAIRKSANNDLSKEDKIKTKTLSDGDAMYTSDDLARMLVKGDVTKAQEIIDSLNETYKEKGSKTTAKSKVTEIMKPLYLNATGSEKDRILRMLYRLKEDGKQMYSSKDIAKWK